jgi:hypothetical protein
MSSSELEKRCISSHLLRSKWLSLNWTSSPRSWDFKRQFDFRVSPSTAIYHICFIPGRGNRWLVTLTRGIWPVITLWEIGPPFTMRSQWSPKGAIINGIALNEDIESEAVLGVGLMHDRLVFLYHYDAFASSSRVSRSMDHRTTQLLTIEQDGNLAPLVEIKAQFRPLALNGDILVTSDDTSTTMVYNWRTGSRATLDHSQLEDTPWQVTPLSCYPAILR